MTEAAPSDTPEWKTGTLWGILAVFLVTGTLGGALFVFALTAWVIPGAVVPGAIFAALGALVAFLSFLFMAGILYRVDRYRGANQRVVRLFE